ncbi:MULTISPECIES: sulfatase-like hydrolase/transferase [unclassified Sphingopyxis]|uniref:sulfatase-like hydrolase/transferase n=1 Tax=unclassified Sphingopyxis TaxID=2614943 RepID=UPI0007365A7D|nr:MULTISPECIES: sulfatase-like hydrolase/transferase [unclassified Sphingopyxis]KTE37396.1 sulfatase [Sphingopyxis sp. HIX]KTE85496.1 sulfatase [Sphingopyxis sp. HXXIV]
MKKRWIALGVVALLGAGGYWTFEANKFRLPGVLQDWRDPVQPNRPVAWAAGPASAPTGERRPNIILIVADDLGINDISLNGGGVAGGIVKTPNIDALARQGMNFTTAYAANATCSPSRAAMMTGRYATRFGFEYTAVPVQFSENMAHGDGVGPLKAVFHKELITPDIPDYPDMGVPASEVTIAEAVKAAGYHTLHIGKWHLGEAPKLQPHAQGFDESLAVLGGAAMFLPEDDPDTVNAKLPWDPIDRFLWANLRHAVTFNGGERFHPKGHMTDYFADEAIAAIEANKNRPFFMYLAFNAPHTPLQATKEDYAKLPQIKDHKTRVYGAMIAQLDRRIGDIMAKLKAAGIDDNTLVIFTSDNGGAWYTGIADHNKPYRGWKATFFEGGIRTPFFMRWPAKIAAGSTRADMTGHIDIFSTIAAAAGAALPTGRTVDSEDILAGPAKRPALFWRSGDYRAVRAGDWKLQVTKRPEKAWLYNLAADPTEQYDLAAAEPARVAAMKAMLEAQNKDMAKPIWPGLIEGPVRIDVPLNAPWQDGQDYIYWTN